jgi:hypothetical protein
MANLFDQRGYLSNFCSQKLQLVAVRALTVFIDGTFKLISV